MAQFLKDKALGEDPVLYYDLCEAQRRGTAQVLFQREDALLFLETVSGEYFGYAWGEAAAEAVINALPKEYPSFVAHQPELVRAMAKLRGVGYQFSCRQIAAVEPVMPGEPGPYTYRWLDESFIPALIEHYAVKFMCTREHMLSRIKDGVLGAFSGEELAGFISTHDDGAVGMLQVLPAFQRKGVATRLEQRFLKEWQQRGHFVYAQIVDGNDASMGLQRKLGMSVSKGKCYWYFEDDDSYQFSSTPREP